MRGQIFSTTGRPKGAEFLVNTTLLSYQYYPSITALSDGRFIVAWEDGSKTGSDLSGSAIRGQVFTASGAYSGKEFLVNTTTAFDQTEVTVTELQDGRVAIAWRDVSDGSNADIRGQIFDPREAAVNLVGTAGDDDFIGTKFDDVLRGGVRQGSADRGWRQ